MRTIYLLAVALVLLALGLQPSVAGDWTVARVTGTAWLIKEGAKDRALERDMTVPTGSRVKTARNGRVRLENGSTSMMLAPNTAAEMKPKTLFRRRTTVLQTTGRIEFDVEKRGRPHFEVKTPYMAAVVKGTRFTVSISRETASIAVTEGLVGVTDPQSGESADVGAGQKASAGSKSAGLSTSPGVSRSSAGKAAGKSAAKSRGSKAASSGAASPAAESAGRGGGGSQSAGEEGHQGGYDGSQGHGRGGWNGRGKGRGGWNGHGGGRHGHGKGHGRGRGHGGWHGRHR